MTIMDRTDVRDTGATPMMTLYDVLMTTLVQLSESWARAFWDDRTALTRLHVMHVHDFFKCHTCAWLL